ncbi:TPA: hypothetical protein ACH3X3_010090 [Trebouxia sp. C0006]
MVRSALACRSGCRAANQPAIAHLLQHLSTTSGCLLLGTPTANMSFNTAKLSLSSKFVTTVAFRPSVRHTVRSRGALQVHNATLWSLASKGKEIELTDTVGKKSICGVGGEGSDQDKSLPGIEGIHVEFVASGESDPTDSPSDLAIKVGLQAQ